MIDSVVGTLDLHKEIIGSNDSNVLKLSCRGLVGPGSKANAAIYEASGSDAGLLDSEAS